MKALVLAADPGSATSHDCCLDEDVAGCYSHCYFALGLPGLRRQAAVAITCPTLVLTELLPGSLAEGWPCSSGGGTGGDLPSGGKRTCPGGGI